MGQHTPPDVSMMIKTEPICVAVVRNRNCVSSVLFCLSQLENDKKRGVKVVENRWIWQCVYLKIESDTAGAICKLAVSTATDKFVSFVSLVWVGGWVIDPIVNPSKWYVFFGQFKGFIFFWRGTSSIYRGAHIGGSAIRLFKTRLLNSTCIKFGIRFSGFCDGY